MYKRRVIRKERAWRERWSPRPQKGFVLKPDCWEGWRGDELWSVARWAPAHKSVSHDLTWGGRGSASLAYKHVNLPQWLQLPHNHSHRLGRECVQQWDGTWDYACKCEALERSEGSRGKKKKHYCVTGCTCLCVCACGGPLTPQLLANLVRE